MGETDLTAAETWEGPGVDIRLNPRLDWDTGGLEAFVTGLRLDGASVFATSGSTGSGPKFVVLGKRAILASADMVNRHLEVTGEDRWLCALTTFHVGGIGVWARAWRAGCPVFGIDGERWDRSGNGFVEACRDNAISLTALTPVHLHDVVSNRHEAPGSLRAVLIGGAALDKALLHSAIELGWPILRTFGMTEAASQVATDRVGAARQNDRPESLPVLSDWDVGRQDGCLAIRGPALFHGYAMRNRDSGDWELDHPFSERGFFTTRDRVKLEGDALTFEGRADDRVKKLGELVSLDRLRERLREWFPDRTATIVARHHDRIGSELIAIAAGEDAVRVRLHIEAFNRTVAPFERIDGFCLVETLPGTGIGKVAHGRLATMLAEGRLSPNSMEG